MQLTNLSLEEEAGPDHLVRVLGLGALNNRPHLLLCDFLLLRIMHLEANLLSVGHGHFEFVLNLVVHPPVLESILFHLLKGLVFFGCLALLFHFGSHPAKGSLELLESYLSVVVEVEL